MSLADILAKKKAALAAAYSPPIQPKVEPLPTSFAKTDVATGKDTAAYLDKKEEVAVKPANPIPAKPNAFLAKMQAQKEAQKTVAPATQIISSVLDVSSLKDEAVATPVLEDTTTESHSFELAPDTPSEEAYKVIKLQIEELESFFSSETDLKDAMRILKKNLMSNPSAVSLMEDTDIGKMVIALSQLVKEEAIAATDVGKKKTKSKFTAEELQAALDEI